MTPHNQQHLTPFPQPTPPSPHQHYTDPIHSMYTSITQQLQSLSNKVDTISTPQPTLLHQWTTPSQQTSHSPYFPLPTQHQQQWAPPLRKPPPTTHRVTPHNSQR
ncbi:hypothetical protein Pcinc_011434 [Petrolisthes cinctipes]|uniref:Uncharacterized protein n=1 Tax=Petrolisthes cinctipes TaxID=88211 RepID=A0AAE1G2T3_PETCI|nr:hypothetical protein Pcinc_011434 [Petrolisthes cinctipes]